MSWGIGLGGRLERRCFDFVWFWDGVEEGHHIMAMNMARPANEAFHS